MTVNVLTWIVKALRASEVPMDGETIYKAVEHHVDKQSLYSMLSYHSRKSQLLLRTQDPVTTYYKYAINPAKTLPSNVVDDLLRLEQKDRESQAEAEAALATAAKSAAAPAPAKNEPPLASSPAEKPKLAVPTLGAGYFDTCDDAKPCVQTTTGCRKGHCVRRPNKAPEIKVGPMVLAPPAPDPYIAVLDTLGARRASLASELERVDKAIEAVKAIA